MSNIKANKIKISLVVLIGLAIIASGVFLMGRNSDSSVKLPKDPTIIVKHKDMNKELKNEKKVASGEVYLKSDVVVANITLKENTTKDEAKVLATKYANELKSQYKEIPVIVDVKQGGKDIVKELIPVKEDQLAAETGTLLGIEYITVDFKELLSKDVTKVLMNEKQLNKNSYEISDGQLRILNANKDSKIKVILGKKTYNVVFIKK
ncbi:hypothetical protein K9O30_01885 [Clostridium bowmanii]|uniref:hypothetical protein n=1 Tax=Clostridium bowmanii TaxID=132925 RepID=UPI001C0BAF98|nr:hypothetical protein [Clostridium bowmanii]MBU3190280.1 hypothetical protein [Clostridium bowmanii]MCA1072508.1 hypothetical protein [Clostridium bowmanii]